MSEKITWSFTAGASSGAGLTSNGSIDAGATMSLTETLDANMTGTRDLMLQLDTAASIVFLAVESSVSDGTVEVQADGATATKLTGPLVLVGNAVGLFANDLTTLKAQNKHTTEEAVLSVLIGLKLT